jgi:hypothetical protein
MKILKWRTLREKNLQKGKKDNQLEVNSKILGLGPIFIVKLEI